jgi:hypothetical protein
MNIFLKLLKREYILMLNKKDPLLNNGLVKNNPTPRQEQILSQLATLKQVIVYLLFIYRILN